MFSRKIAKSMLQPRLNPRLFAGILALVATLGTASFSLAAPPSRGPQLPESGAAQPVMTFQAWKGLRLEEARLVLERLTFENQADRTAVVERSPGEKQAVVKASVELVKSTAVARTTKAASRSDSRIEQAQMNLEIAQDLTVNDYLQIYLSRFRSREALLDVARRMAPEDVVDLLLSYQKLVSGSQIAEHSSAPAPRLSPRPL